MKILMECKVFKYNTRIGKKLIISFLMAYILVKGIYLTQKVTNKNLNSTFQNEHYVILSCSIINETTNKLNHYCFYLPIVILSWKRIGYKAIVIISISKEAKFSYFHQIFFKQLNQLDDTIVLNVTSPNDATTKLVSMVGRLFVAGIKY